MTISDFVADVRAATPSNAAEIAVPDTVALRRSIKDSEARLYSLILSKLNFKREALKNISQKNVMKSPQSFFAERRLNLDFLAEKLAGNTNRSILKSKERFAKSVASLDAMSPLKVLSRGYSIATAENGKVIKRVSDAVSGEKVILRVEDGNINCTVDDTEVF